jgi:hypothetical protein
MLVPMALLILGITSMNPLFIIAISFLQVFFNSSLFQKLLGKDVSDDKKSLSDFIKEGVEGIMGGGIEGLLEGEMKKQKGLLVEVLVSMGNMYTWQNFSKGGSGWIGLVFMIVSLVLFIAKKGVELGMDEDKEGEVGTRELMKEGVEGLLGRLKSLFTSGSS